MQLEAKSILVEMCEREMLLAINCVWISLFFPCMEIKKNTMVVLL